VLSGTSASASGDNIGASGEPGEPNPLGVSGASVWYSWTAPTTGKTLVSGGGPPLRVYTGDRVDDLKAVESQGRTTGGSFKFRGDAGVTYRIAIHGGTGPTRTHFSLRLSHTEAPPNDDFANAAELAGSGPLTGNNRGATREYPEPTLYSGEGSVWYHWTAPADGRVTIAAWSESYYSDPDVAVFTGSSLRDLTMVSRQYEGHPRFQTKEGTKYWIQVDEHHGSTMEFKVQAFFSKAPPNDDFADAAPLRGSADSAAGTNLGATREAGEPMYLGGAWGVATTVWYRWRAPADAEVTVRAASTQIDALLGVYRGSSLDSLTEVGWGDDADGGRDSRVTFRATRGVVYRFLIAGKWHREGNLAISVRHAASPANDTFADAASVDAGTPVTGTNVGATKQQGEPRHAGDPGGASVWYRWTAPADGTLELSTEGSDFDTLLAAYSGESLEGLAPVASSDDAVPAVSWSAARTSVSEGRTYLIAVDGADDGEGPSQGAVRLELEFEEAGPVVVAEPAPELPAEDDPTDEPAAEDSTGEDLTDQPAAELPAGEPLAEEALAEQAPADEAPPAEEPPAEPAREAVEESPADETAGEEPAGEEVIADEVIEEAVEETLPEEPASEEEPAAEQSAEQPAEEKPTEPPVEESPAEEPEAEAPAAEEPIDEVIEEAVEETLPEELVAEQPAEELPAGEQPAEEAPADETPAEDATEEQPADETPADAQVAEETLAEEPAAEDVIDDEVIEEAVEETLPEERQTEADGGDEVPADETPAEETPVEEDPAEETSAEETSAEEDPAEEARAEEEPAEETPVDEQTGDEQPVEEEQADEQPADEPQLGDDAPAVDEQPPPVPRTQTAGPPSPPAAEEPPLSVDVTLSPQRLRTVLKRGLTTTATCCSAAAPSRRPR
jgi:hypothetical protein